IIILGTVSGVFANSLSIMMTCFFIVASQGVSYRWYLRTTLIVVAVSAIVFPALSILEIVPDKVIFRGESGTVRRSLGFAHPNTFAAAIMTICLCWVVLRFGKTTLADVIGQGILVAFIFMISDGRMAALVSILGIVYSIYYRFRHGYPMWLARFAWILVIVLPLLSLYFMTNFSSQNAMHMQIDSIFSGRFSILHALYQTYGYSMLGQPVELWGWGSVPQTADGGIQLLDNVFIAFSIRYGFVLFIFVLLGYLLLLRFANRNGIGYMPMLIIVFFIYGFTETNFVLLATNISLVLLNLVVFEDAPCSLTDLVTNEIGFSEQCI
ncbi:MAG: hypothetical protein FWF71_03230, partial [Actinomycetia bacterium]|nr:hypothetical protein [Actinomycetes bacterium]